MFFSAQPSIRSQFILPTSQQDWILNIRLLCDDWIQSYFPNPTLISKSAFIFPALRHPTKGCKAKNGGKIPRKTRIMGQIAVFLPSISPHGLQIIVLVAFFQMENPLYFARVQGTCL